MTSMPDDESALVHPWVAHLLALITFLTLLFALFGSLFFLSDGDRFVLDPYLGLPIGLAMIWLFLWMAADVFGGRRTSDRAGWFIFMALIPFISTLVYYFFIWRPAKSTAPN